MCTDKSMEAWWCRFSFPHIFKEIFHSNIRGPLTCQHSLGGFEGFQKVMQTQNGAIKVLTVFNSPNPFQAKRWKRARALLVHLLSRFHEKLILSRLCMIAWHTMLNLNTVPSRIYLTPIVLPQRGLIWIEDVENWRKQK